MVAETRTIKTPYGDEEVCAKCGGDVDWEECNDCEEGYSYHDCGEDCCACLDPQPNVICDTCEGKSGWWRCYSCESEKQKTEVKFDLLLLTILYTVDVIVTKYFFYVYLLVDL